MRNLLGIDLGTSSVKAVIIDEQGALISRAQGEYPLHTPFPGYAEQEPHEWWRAVVTTVGKAVSLAGCPVDAIGLSGQMHGTVLLGEHARHLGPAIIWPDQRSVEEVGDFVRLVGEGRLAQIAGTAPATGFMGPTLLWLKKNDPARLEKARTCILPKDYLKLVLTGEISTEATDASSTALFDVGKRTWSDEIIAEIGLSRDLFPPVLEPAQVAGRLRKGPAQELGLDPGIPVVAGCGDQVAQAISKGLINPGRGSVTLGSGGQIFIPLDRVLTQPSLNLHLFCHAPPDRWYLLGAMLTAGLSLRWLRDLLELQDTPNAFAKLSSLAAEVPPGADGLIFLPYLAGERSPLMDPEAKGAYIGLTLRHTNAHLARAIMEGVAMALRHILDTISAHQATAHQLVGGGNGLNDPTWRQIVADVLNKPICMSPASEHAGRGAALVAGIGAGIYNNYEQVAGLASPITEITEPLTAQVERYAQRYANFKQLYPLLKPIFQSSR